MALQEIIKTGKSLSQITSDLDLNNVISSESELDKIITQVIQEESKAWQEAKTNPQTINYLVGIIMKKTRGKADPKSVINLIQKKIQ
jgi:aspartyl-tRNA(Asn)/glutamyl-tRNA(Gln) amidotransferase subunit B